MSTSGTPQGAPIDFGTPSGGGGGGLQIFIDPSQAPDADAHRFQDPLLALAAAAAATVPVEIVVMSDTTLNNPVQTTYALPAGSSIRGIRLDPQANVRLTFEDGVRLTGVNFASYLALEMDSTDGFSGFFGNTTATLIGCAVLDDGTPNNLMFDTAASGAVALFTSQVTGRIGANGGAGDFNVLAFAGSSVDQDTLNGANVFAGGDSSSEINSTQADVTGVLTQQFLSQLALVGVDALVGANFAGPAPTNLAEAINRMAALLVTLNGALPIP